MNSASQVGQGYLKTNDSGKESDASPHLAYYAIQVTQCMPVIYDGRSLGTHMDTTSRKRGTTVTRRIEMAVDCCHKIAQLPVGLTEILMMTMTMLCCMLTGYSY